MDIVVSFAISVAYIVIGLIVLLLAKVVKDFTTPFKVDDQLTTQDNPAYGVVVAGYFAGVIIVFLGATVGEDIDFYAPAEQPPTIESEAAEVESVDVEGAGEGEVEADESEAAAAPTSQDQLNALAAMFMIDFLYAVIGILLLNVGRLVVDKFVLHDFSTVKEIIEDRNVGTAAVEAGCYIATGLVLAGAIHGESDSLLDGLLSTAVFFVLGQLALVLFVWFYQWITHYDIHAEIEADNVAAGMALGFSMIAMGVIIMKASAGVVDGWGDKLLSFAAYVVVGALLLMVLRKVTDSIFLPGATISHEIANDKNVNAAWLEGVVATGVAAMIFFLV